MFASNRRGYTLIELVVTVLIIGILTSIAVPQYLKTVETSKADDAVATVNMIGTTNKMYALDHGGVYAVGPFSPGDGTGACGTNAGANPSCPLVPTSGCDLVWCKYLADQNWAAKPYAYKALDGSNGNPTASTLRVTGGTYGTTAGSTYSNWGYTVQSNGLIVAIPGSGAPPPTF